MQFLKAQEAPASGADASSSDSTPTAGRRKFFARAAAATAGTAALGVPMVSRAQTVSFRFQSTWPAKDIFHEYANDFAKKINDMAGNRLKIEVLPSGAVVRAFDLLDAVAKGTLDGGHAWWPTGTARTPPWRCGARARPTA
jgi:TRAP-type mannitol/chloroaromatic compound transport system substrate-binding protein